MSWALNCLLFHTELEEGKKKVRQNDVPCLTGSVGFLLFLFIYFILAAVTRMHWCCSCR